MERLDATAVRAVRALLDTQPLTEAKVRFAWTIAAGPALTRAATATFADGTLWLRARSPVWRAELLRARPVLVDRLAGLLGTEAIRSVRVSTEVDESDATLTRPPAHDRR